MTEPPQPTPSAPKHRASIDFVFVVAISIGVFLIAAYLELTEKVLAWTRPFEPWQIDEVPEMLLAFAIGMGWFALRRRQELKTEIALRRDAQGQAFDLLEQNRKLTQRLMMLQDEERLAIARDLHDELGQNLTAIKVEATSLGNLTAAQLSEIHAGATRIAQTADQVYNVVRSMLRRLRPATLDSLGLAATLRELVESWQYRKDLSTSFKVEGAVDELGESININLYRIVQEALTNISKHANAQTVNVNLRQYQISSQSGRTKSWIRLLIQDDGIGMPASDQIFGLGVLGMRERVQALGGQFEIDSGAYQGARITITIPVSGDYGRTAN